MSRLLLAAILAGAAVPAILAWSALIGLGLHRHGAPWAVSAAATTLLFGPPLLAAGVSRYHRIATLGSALAGWAVTLLIGMPLYFPGERRSAVATGLALLGLGTGWEDVARTVADNLPEEPRLSEPELAEAVARVEPEPLPPVPLLDHQIALPYEGEGRRLSVPVVFEHGGTSVEVYMMLDTGATYTTLPAETLASLGIFPDDDDPRIELHTANGVREASIVLLDRVWLGDLWLDGVSVATCEQCAFSDTVGLLGLNVTGAYNMTIDADRREVVFSSRKRFDRHLDVRQFSELGATFTPFPGGRVEVEVTLENRSERPITEASAEIRCGEHTWDVDVGAVPARAIVSSRRRLPDHERCSQYAIGLGSASW